MMKPMIAVTLIMPRMNSTSEDVSADFEDDEIINRRAKSLLRRASLVVTSRRQAEMHCRRTQEGQNRV